jgi:zinc transport system substrate-binding protein
MSKRRLPAILTLVLATLALFACSGGSQATDSGKPLVLCTIFSYYDAARAIAGDKLAVQILLPVNQSPHEYQPTMDDKVTASHAKLFIMNGLGLDDRLAALLTDSSAKKLVIGDLIPKTQLLHTEEVSLGETPSHEEEAQTLGNPHVWLDPAIQIKAAELIRDAFVDLDPADKSTFQANADKYIADVQALDRQFTEAVKSFKTRDFIGFHSAYEYLAHRYGLHQVASIEEIPGAGLSLAQIQKILDIIKSSHIRYIAVETALSGKAADKIKEEGHVDTIVLQPLETYDNPNDTYVSLMKQNLDSLKTALGG